MPLPCVALQYVTDALAGQVTEEAGNPTPAIHLCSHVGQAFMACSRVPICRAEALPHMSGSVTTQASTGSSVPAADRPGLKSRPYIPQRPFLPGGG
jgi:hypothetical protein